MYYISMQYGCGEKCNLLPFVYINLMNQYDKKYSHCDEKLDISRQSLL